MRPRPAGADNFLKWRRIIDEHLELRRMTWDEIRWPSERSSPSSPGERPSAEDPPNPTALEAGPGAPGEASTP